MKMPYRVKSKLPVECQRSDGRCYLSTKKNYSDTYRWDGHKRDAQQRPAPTRVVGKMGEKVLVVSHDRRNAQDESPF
jgi:hypothetical protein